MASKNNQLAMPNTQHDPKSEGAEWEREFVEQGADLEHERWAKWQAYLHSKCVEHSNGEEKWVCFPAELFERWERQIATRYDDLSEAEKESDRKEARTYLPLVAQQRQQAVAEFVREVVKLSDRIELEGPDGGTKEWMAFKRFRNTVRDIAKERGIELDQPINSIFKE